MLRQTLDWLWSAPPSANPTIAARTRLLLLDTIGCAIAGTAEPEIQSLAAALDPGPIPFPGLPNLSPAALTVTFAAAACWHEACEGLAAAHGRPGLHAIPPVLAHALLHRRPLADIIDAVATGYEVGARLGAAWRIKPGLHVDGAWGTFAAAAAMSRLTRLTPAQAHSAIEHAACHLPLSLYRPIAAGSTARNAYAGHGAWLGTLAAAATAAGLGGPPGALQEAYRLAMDRDLPPIHPPGHWFLPEGYLKAYAAVKHVHYGAAAGTQFHASGTKGPIRQVILRAYPEAITYCANRAPRTPIQAQFSLTYGLAWSMLHGDLAPDAYATLDNPAVTALESRIELEVLQTEIRACELQVEADTPFTTRIDSVPGDPGHPLDVPAKFHRYTRSLSPAQADRIVAHLLQAPLDTPITLD